MIKSKNKNKKFATAFLLLAFLLLANPSRAGYWGEPTAAAKIINVVREAMINIRGAILGATKQAATQEINEMVTESLIGKAIDDHLTFIYEPSFGAAETYKVGYIADLEEGASMGTRDRVGVVEKMLDNNLHPAKPRALIDDVVQSETPVLDAFNPNAGGGSAAVKALAADPNSSVVGMYSQGLAGMQTAAEMQSESQKLEATSFGFPTNNGVSGFVQASVFSKSMGMPIEVISGATHPAEVLTAVALSTYDKFLKKGFDTVNNTFFSQSRSLNQQAGGADQILDAIYRGTQTMEEVRTDQRQVVGQ